MAGELLVVAAKIEMVLAGVADFVGSGPVVVWRDDEKWDFSSSCTRYKGVLPSPKNLPCEKWLGGCHVSGNYKGLSWHLQQVVLPLSRYKPR